MRRIHLKEVPCAAFPDGMLNYKQQLLALVIAAPAQGMDVAAMRQAVRVAAAIEQTESRNDVLLEEADWLYLKKRIEETRYARATPELLEMIDAVIGAQTVSVTPAAAAQPVAQAIA